MPSSRGSSQHRDGSQVSHLIDERDRIQPYVLKLLLCICAFFFKPSEPPGKPKNTGMGSLTLLQMIFPTQELNQGLLHCRQILYQQSQEQYPLIQESISLFALLRLSTDWRRPGLGRAICFIHSTDSHVSLIQKHPYGNIQNNV